MRHEHACNSTVIPLSFPPMACSVDVSYVKIHDVSSLLPSLLGSAFNFCVCRRGTLHLPVVPFDELGRPNGTGEFVLNEYRPAADEA